MNETRENAFILGCWAPNDVTSAVGRNLARAPLVQGM